MGRGTEVAEEGEEEEKEENIERRETKACTTTSPPRAGARTQRARGGDSATCSDGTRSKKTRQDRGEKQETRQGRGRGRGSKKRLIQYTH